MRSKELSSFSTTWKQKTTRKLLLSEVSVRIHTHVRYWTDSTWRDPENLVIRTQGEKKHISTGPALVSLNIKT
jgi:hypothetical protein